MTSKELFDRALKVSPGGVQSPVRAFKSVGGTPIFFEKAQGAHLTSVEGNKYIDFCQSFGPLVLGHRDPDVQEVVQSMVDTAWTFGACEHYSLELAEWMTARIPWLERLRFVSSGTEAVMSTLRVARACTGRNKVLKFEGCYHGHVDSMLVKAGSGLAGQQTGQSASDSAGVSDQVASDTLVLPLNDLPALRETFQTQGQDIAAVIIEPAPANFGLLVQKKAFLTELQSLCKKNGSLLVFDEVISGFRVALGGMAELLGIHPDMVCYGKVIGGGFPVGCYGGRKDLMDLVAPSGPVYQAGTLSGNPIGMRAGLATLKKVEENNYWKVMAKRTRGFALDLEKMAHAKGLNLKVAFLPSLMWMHRGDQRRPKSLTELPQGHGEHFKTMFHQSLEKGLYLAPSGFEVSFLSWAHTEEILEESKKAFSSVFDDLLKEKH